MDSPIEISKMENLENTICYNGFVGLENRDGLFENQETHMERAVAVKKLAKILGKNFGYRVNPKSATAEEREAAKASIPSACAERDKLIADRKARHEQLLTDPEYLRLKEAANEASKKVHQLSSITHSYKITVRKTVLGLAFSVSAEGDSWEEVIDKLSK